MNIKVNNKANTKANTKVAAIANAIVGEIVIVSHATRLRDIIPALCFTLRELGGDPDSIVDYEMYLRDKHNHPYWASEKRNYELDALCNAIELFLPEGYWVGMHPYDAACWGIWLREEEGEEE
jgi:hypothetical protein